MLSFVFVRWLFVVCRCLLLVACCCRCLLLFVVLFGAWCLADALLAVVVRCLWFVAVVFVRCLMLFDV